MTIRPANIHVRFSALSPFAGDYFAEAIRQEQAFADAEAQGLADEVEEYARTSGHDFVSALQIVRMRRDYDALGRTFAEMGKAIRAIGITAADLVDGIDDTARLGVSMDADSEPQSRAERRQQASPRYQRAVSHGADGQRERAHKAWRSE